MIGELPDWFVIEPPIGAYLKSSLKSSLKLLWWGQCSTISTARWSSISEVGCIIICNIWINGFNQTNHWREKEKDILTKNNYVCIFSRTQTETTPQTLQSLPCRPLEKVSPLINWAFDNYCHKDALYITFLLFELIIIAWWTTSSVKV